MLKRCIVFSTLTLYHLTAALLVTGCESSPKADMVIHNGTIYTMDQAMPIAEAVAVVDGKIAFAGSEANAKKWISAETNVLDLKGRTMTPGFIDSHIHLLSLGKAIMRLDLLETKNYMEVVAQVAEAAKKTKPGEWILGRGWHQSKWSPAPKLVKGFPTHHALSAVSPDNPVYLTHASGHAGLANANAMKLAGITADTQFNDGGEIIKDRQGNPTGIFNDLAMMLITGKIPDSTPESDRRALELGIQEALRNGITSIQDADAGEKDVRLYKQFLNDGKLKARLWVMLSSRDKRLLAEYYNKGPEIGLGNHFLTIRSIKLFGDGALGTRGAWLLEPYADRPRHTGYETMPMDSVYIVAKAALKHGFQVCTHAIGDRTNREVLNQYEKAFKEIPEKARDHRFRIEHAQHLHPDDILRFAKLGIIASMQGIHMASDRPWAIDRLGKKRIVEGAYVWQKLLKSGARVVNGTDAPVEPIDPIACFYASVTRRTLKGMPPGGYEPEQNMTRDQALRSYTLDAAYGGFEEKIKGSIEVGKLADFTVFSQDIMTAPDSELLKTTVDYTIVDGKIVYSRDEVQEDKIK